MLIFTLLFSRRELVRLFATEVCTAGIENTINKIMNNKTRATSVLVSIFQNFLIRYYVLTLRLIYNFYVQ